MIYAVYFSPTGTTKRVVLRIANTLAKRVNAELREVDYAAPSVRAEGLRFAEEDLVVFGMPVYAGRVPNLIARDFTEIRGGGAKCIPVVLFGNRAYDDALIELRDLLFERGLMPVAAGAFVGEHSFSEQLAAGRPAEQDLILADRLAEEANLASEELITVRGTPKPYGGYYQPRYPDGTPIDIRKVKPKTSSACTKCCLCASICPMGSIDAADPSLVSGVCVKCGACIKRCPNHAKYLDDAGFLAHKEDLELRQAEPKQCEIFY